MSLVVQAWRYKVAATALLCVSVANLWVFTAEVSGYWRWHNEAWLALALAGSGLARSAYMLGSRR